MESPPVFRFNFRMHPTARGKVANHFRGNRLARRNDISQNPIDRILIKNSEIAIFLDVHLEGLQFQTKLVRPVLDGDGTEIRQTGFGTHRRVFGIRNRYVIAGKLVRPAFDGGELRVDSGFGVGFVVIRHPRYSGAFSPKIQKPSGGVVRLRAFVPSLLLSVAYDSARNILLPGDPSPRSRPDPRRRLPSLAGVALLLLGISSCIIKTAEM